jgi:HEAT repeat protein
MSSVRTIRARLFWIGVLAIVLTTATGRGSIAAQDNRTLTPLQREIENQRRRLTTGEIEERRDALMRLGNLKRPEAARIAAIGLNDAAPIVRVAAMHAILSLPEPQSVPLLIPLLQDKLEFVRREAAYVLGETHGRKAVPSLVSVLVSDKESSVRAAAALALGEIRDESAAQPLSQILASRSENKKKKKASGKEDVFVMRAAAHSLGQIKSRAAVQILIAALENDGNDNDVRREAATALGLIGDSSAGPSLQAALASSDPYLSQAAREALRLLKRSGK